MLFARNEIFFTHLPEIWLYTSSRQGNTFYKQQMFTDGTVITATNITQRKCLHYMNIKLQNTVFISRKTASFR